ncbi:MAG: acyl-CoA dehydrogenase, partial [Gammaproteobacteria bacterium]|nr:acyl-CoA dehydrogenase [Gammaproteobacteria bacterium]
MQPAIGRWPRRFTWPSRTGQTGPADMAMNVRPVQTLDAEVNDIRLATAEIVNEDILPAEDKLWGWMAEGARAPKTVVDEARELRHGIQNKVKDLGLWAPHLPREFGGMGLTFMQHAFMNEVLAYSPGAASLFGV